MPPVESSAARRRTMLALIVGQVCIHATMAGVRMAAPLLALRQGSSAWAVGVLLALFAAPPILLALQAGRYADRHGYHRPLGIAVACGVSGGTLAVLASLLAAHTGLAFGLLCGAAVLAGTAANIGLITIQRSAGRMAANPTELKQVFSWLGLAPAVANMAGPMLAGVLIDSLGFAAAFGALALLPLGTLASARQVPRESALASPRPPAPQGAAAGAARPGVARSAWQLLGTPGLKRLLLVNWLISGCWDVHSFVLPILGHERGFSASQIGGVLGTFAASVALVRLLIPWLAHRLRESQVMAGAMLAAGLVFAVYPLFHTVPPLLACATVLGLALGSVQPMIMTTLHQLTPPDRHGEAIALRSMAINGSSTLMPLAFGVLGGALGTAGLFWLMGLAVAAGSAAARGLKA